MNDDKSRFQVMIIYLYFNYDTLKSLEYLLIVLAVWFLVWLEAAITDNMVQLQRKEKGEKKGTSLKQAKSTGGGGRRRRRCRDCGYAVRADDAGIASRLSEGSWRG